MSNMLRQQREVYTVAPDGTTLSIVDNGEHKYNRQELRRHISDVTGMTFPPFDFQEE